MVGLAKSFDKFLDELYDSDHWCCKPAAFMIIVMAIIVSVVVLVIAVSYLIHYTSLATVVIGALSWVVAIISCGIYHKGK